MRYWAAPASAASPMRLPHLRPLVVVYALCLVLCAIGYARYDNYQLDGDAVAFMDIADAIHARDAARVVNGYWNPGYAAALYVGEVVARPTRWAELQTFFWVNFVIFVGCIVACVAFVHALGEARDRLVIDGPSEAALPTGLLQLTGLALLFASFQRELPLGAVRADALLLLFFLLAATLVLRVQAGGGFGCYAGLGLVLGLGFLTKSFAFLPSGILLAGIFVFGLVRRRRGVIAGAVVAGIVFTALAGPYIAAISKQRGRLTTGESARLNYAFFIDHTARWHEWHTGDLGRATATFKHHEELLLERPAVYSYAGHPVGTYPLWFDPAYWTDTLQPHFTWKGHAQRLARCSALLLRFVVGHLEAFLLVALLVAGGCFFPRGRASWMPLLPVAVWGGLIFAIYFPIDLQDRYLTGGLLLIALPVLAALRRPLGSEGRSGLATGAVLLLAGVVLANAVSDLAQRRRTLSVAGVPRGAYDAEIYPAAQALVTLVPPGSSVACFGDKACYLDHYWARLAGTPIRAEIEVPRSGDPGAFWSSLANRAEVVETLRGHGIGAIVGVFAPSTQAPEGWRKLGTSDFYAYPMTASATGSRGTEGMLCGSPCHTGMER